MSGLHLGVSKGNGQEKNLLMDSIATAMGKMWLNLVKTKKQTCKGVPVNSTLWGAA